MRKKDQSLRSMTFYTFRWRRKLVKDENIQKSYWCSDTIFKNTLNLNIFCNLSAAENPSNNSFQGSKDVQLIICKYVPKIISAIIVRKPDV